MEYTTINGAILEVGAIPRQEIDKFLASHPEPEPPTREVETWGGFTEQVLVLDDTSYQADLAEYYWRAGYEQIDLIAPAITILDAGENETEFDDLCVLGLADGDDKASLLQYVVLGSEEDMAAVTSLVFYNSTVTQKGIDEAAKSLGVTWMGQPVLSWHVPNTPGRYSALHEAMKVAKEYHYRWQEFCTLTGPEQSLLVAHYRLENRLQWLIAKSH